MEDLGQGRVNNLNQVSLTWVHFSAFEDALNTCFSDTMSVLNDLHLYVHKQENPHQALLCEQE